MTFPLNHHIVLFHTVPCWRQVCFLPCSWRLQFHPITTPSSRTWVRKLKFLVSLNCFSERTYGEISSSLSRTTLKTASVIKESICSQWLEIIKMSISDSSVSSPRSTDPNYIILMILSDLMDFANSRAISIRSFILITKKIFLHIYNR